MCIPLLSPHTHSWDSCLSNAFSISLVTASQPPWHWNLPTRTSGLTSGVWTMLRGSFMRPSHRWGITHCYSLSCNPSIACHLLFWFLCQEVWMVFSVFGYKWAVSSVSREILWMLFLFSLFPLSVAGQKTNSSHFNSYALITWNLISGYSPSSSIIIIMWLNNQ